MSTCYQFVGYPDSWGEENRNSNGAANPSRGQGRGQEGNDEEALAQEAVEGIQAEGEPPDGHMRLLISTATEEILLQQTTMPTLMFTNFLVYPLNNGPLF